MVGIGEEIDLCPKSGKVDPKFSVEIEMECADKSIVERARKLQQAASRTMEQEAAQDLEGSKHGLSYWFRRFGIR
jgi:hypothetical protein